MVEFRCKRCGRLIFKGELTQGHIEVVCSRCGYKNIIERRDSSVK